MGLAGKDELHLGATPGARADLKLALQALGPVAHDDDAVAMDGGGLLVEADTVVVDADPDCAVRTVLERDPDLGGPRMPLDVGESFADDLEDVDLPVRGHVQAAQTIVEADLQTGAAAEFLHGVIDGGGEASSIDAQAEGGEQLPQLAVGFAETIPQLLDDLIDPFGRRWVPAEQALQAGHLDLQIGQGLG